MYKYNPKATVWQQGVQQSDIAYCQASQHFVLINTKAKKIFEVVWQV